jgi:hypothetical protein
LDLVWIVSFSKRIQKNKLKTNTKSKSNSNRQIQQGLFEYNIYRQKNKKSSKDKAANTFSTLLGSKGQALRVFVTISTPRCTSGSILTKKP